MKFTVVVNQSAFKGVVIPPTSRRIEDITYDLKAKIFELFGRPKSGRYYHRPKPPGGIYRASAPGESPAIRTGNMFRSTRESFPDPLTGILTVDTPYAQLLETGTSRIAPRPFVKPAIKGVMARYSSGVRGRFQ